MANRYWVGGSGTWDASNTANWSSTSGGAGGQSVPTTADNVFFDAASGAVTITLGYIAQALTLTMTGFTGTLAFGTNKIQIAETAIGASITVVTQPTTMSVTGTPLIELIGAPVNTGFRSISTVNVTEANAISFNFTAGSGTSSVILFITGSSFKNLDTTGFTGTFSQGSSAFNVYGNIFISSGTRFTTAGAVTSFLGTSITQTITTNGVAYGTISVNNSTCTLQIIDNLTLSTGRTFQLTSGTLDLLNNTLTTPIFSSSSNFIRSIQFGTGNITINGTGTVLSMANLNNFSYTGSPTINVSNNSATAATITIGTSAAIDTNVPNINITTGTYALTVSSGSNINNLNFTGFTGTWSPGTATCTFYGSLTMSSGMTFTAGTGVWTFAQTFYTQTITSAGKTFYSITKQGVGGTLQLADALTLNNGLTITSGTFNAVSFNVTAAFVTSTTTNTRTVSMGSGTWTLTGAVLTNGSIWAFGTTASLTFNKDTANIVIANTSRSTFSAAPVFSAGPLTYNNLTISNTSNTTDLLITGTPTFNVVTMSKTVPCALTFSTAGTFNIATLAVSGGSSSSLVTIKTNFLGTNSSVNVTNPFTLDYAVVNNITLSSSNGTVTNGYISPSSTGFSVGSSTNYFDIISSTTSVTYTIPSTWNSTNNSIHLIGGAGGSSGSSIGTVTANRVGGAGGGGGGYAKLNNNSQTPGSSVYCVVGGGGAAGPADVGSGNSVASNGGLTAWGGTLTNPTYVSNAFSQQTAVSTTITVNVPSVSNGNLMIMMLCSTTTPVVWTTPTGWTAGGSGGPNAVFWRIASSEPATYTVTQNNNVRSSAYIVAYANATFARVSTIPSGSSGATISPATTALVYNTAPGSTIVYVGATIAGSTNFSTPTGYTVVATDNDPDAASMAIFNRFNVTSTFSYSFPSTTLTGALNTGWAYGVILSPAATYVATATGGTGGVSSAGTSSTGGTGGVGSGGVLNYTGGNGGAGSTSTTQSIVSGGGGGGAAGPLGNGGNGGNGFTSATVVRAGGGGGNGGGTAGGNGTATLSGAGGNNNLGYGGGSSVSTGTGVSGVAGGGASGSAVSAPGTAGGSGIDILSMFGGGGGGGGSASSSTATAFAQAFGASPGAPGVSTSTTVAAAGSAGAQGIIILIWNTGGSIFTDTITENTSVDDIRNILASFANNITETSSLADTQTVDIQYTFNISESSNLQDVISISFGAAASIIETAHIDSIENTDNEFNLFLSENISINDFNEVLSGFFKNITENVSVDNLNTEVTNFIASLTENGIVSSVETIQAGFNKIITENGTINSVETTQTNYNPVVIENIDLFSLEQAVNDFLVSVTESVTIDDLKTAGISFILSVTENTNLSDVSEVVTLLFENINVSDINSVRIDFIVAVFENVGLLDIICYNGWFKIDTSQPNEWNNIYDSQSAGWSSVDTNQTPSWGNIDTSQPCS
jgi:hypothetical protein